jgi:site-specific DNA-methyltransferase (adenine-specific)
VGHPAQFPIKLAADHIFSWSNEGDLVLDPFLGSGTTRIAAYDLHRQFIGFEISEEYFRMQEERFFKHTEQRSLFEKQEEVVEG